MTKIDRQIDDFYSVPTKSWLKVLGEKRHYHFGRTNPHDPQEDIMDHAVRCLYPLIPDGSAILDCGCGWGGPAQLLSTEKSCRVTGVTTSLLQYKFLKKHVKEIKLIYQDLHQYTPKEKFDCALFLEVMSHVVNPKQVFANLLPKVDAILLVEHISASKSFFAAPWQMYFHTKQEIITMLSESGYELEYCEETLTPEDVRKSAQHWLDGLAKLREEEIVGQLQVLKKSSLTWKECPDTLPWSIATFYAKKKT